MQFTFLLFILSWSSLGIIRGVVAGYLSDKTCCYYSHPDLPDLIHSLLDFESTVMLNDNVVFSYYTNDWSDFNPIAYDLETPIASNAYLQGLIVLRNRVVNVINTNSDTLEDLTLINYLRELNFVIELSELDALWMQYGMAWWDFSWTYDPWQTAADAIDVLISYGGEPDYALKINAWLQALDDKVYRWKDMGQRAIDSGKTHANIQMEIQYDLGYGPYGYKWAFSANYTRLCVTMSPIDKTTCLQRSSSLQTKLANLSVWWTTNYMPACGLYRPNAQPGLWNVPEGDAIYAQLQLYHLGADVNDSYVSHLGYTGVNEILSQYEILRTRVGGAPIPSVTKLIVAMQDLNDARFTLCTQDENVAKNMTALDLQDIAEKMTPLFGFQSRTGIEITITGSASTYMSPGTYDPKKKYWETNSYYNVGVIGTCGPTGLGKKKKDKKQKTPPQYLAYDIVGSKSISAHEGRPGHSLQIPLQTEIDCAFGKYITANTMFVEGWGLHSEFLGNELGFYVTPIQQLGNYKSRALRDNRLREDICLHSSDTSLPTESRHCSYEQAVQMMMDVGFSRSYSESEASRYIIMGAQALGYRLGDIFLQNLRISSEVSVTGAGGNFDPRDFYNVILRFGGGDIAQAMTPLIQTYVKYATAQPINPSDFGSDLIPSKLYSTSNPIVGGLGKEPICTPN